MEFFFSAIHLLSTFIAKIFDVQQFILRALNVVKNYSVPVCRKVSAFLQHYFVFMFKQNVQRIISALQQMQCVFACDALSST